MAPKYHRVLIKMSGEALAGAARVVHGREHPGRVPLGARGLDA